MNIRKYRLFMLVDLSMCKKPISFTPRCVRKSRRIEYTKPVGISGLPLICLEDRQKEKEKGGWSVFACPFVEVL